MIPARRRLTRLTLIATLAMLVALVAAPSVSAAEQTITSAGPLTEIIIGDRLNCQVSHVSDTSNEFFGGEPLGACGTFVVAGGVLYNPASVPAGSSATVGTDYTPVSQTPVTGSGTAADPYRIVTVVTLGTSGLTLTETDSYVIGREFYQTDVMLTLAAGGAASLAATVYRAGDCYLQNSDAGFGSVDAASGAVRCVAAADPLNPAAGPGTRIEEWVPLTAGSTYYQANYSEVWSLIGAMSPFPNTCECAEYQDNGAGLSWQFTVLGGSSATVSHVTNFSPTGISVVPTPTPTPTPVAPTPTPTPTPLAAALPNTAAQDLGATGLALILTAVMLVGSVGGLAFAHRSNLRHRNR